MADNPEVLDLFEVKRRYWAFMLPGLQGAFGNALNHEDEPYYGRSFARRVNAMDVYIEKGVFFSCRRGGTGGRLGTRNFYGSTDGRHIRGRHYMNFVPPPARVPISRYPESRTIYSFEDS